MWSGVGASRVVELVFGRLRGLVVFRWFVCLRLSFVPPRLASWNVKMAFELVDGARLVSRVPLDVALCVPFTPPSHSSVCVCARATLVLVHRLGADGRERSRDQSALAHGSRSSCPRVM